MALTSLLYQQFGFTPTVGAGLELIYSFNKLDPIVDFADISYQYSDESLNRKPFTLLRRTAMGQKIANNFPHWMTLRKDYTSNGNKLINSWGQNLENAFEYVSEIRNESYLLTANQYIDNNYLALELLGHNNKIYTPVLNNLIYNSSFSMMSGGSNSRPAGWGIKRNNLSDLTLNTEESLYGDHAVNLNSNAELAQTFISNISPGPLTYSIFVKTQLDTGEDISERYEATEAGLILYVLFTDSTVKTYGIGFPKNTKQKWARASLTAILQKNIRKLSVKIVNRTSTSYIVDCPMLEPSKNVGQWTPSDKDNNPLLNNEPRAVAGVCVFFDSIDNSNALKIELTGLISEDSFKHVNIPTRIEKVHILNDSSRYSNSRYSKHINFHNEVIPTMWTVDNGYIQERGISTYDVFGKRKPADLVLSENGELYLDYSLIASSNTEVKASSALGDNLLVITKDTYAGSTKYYLKIVSPKYIDYEQDYLPSLAAFELPVDIGTNVRYKEIDEDINNIGICKNIPNTIFITTTLNRRIYFRLFYDYYYPNFFQRRVYCKEQYTKTGGQVTII